MHFFALGIHTRLLAAADAAHKSAGYDGDYEHAQKGQRVAGELEIEMKIRIGEGIIDAENRHDRGDQTEKITVRAQTYHQNYKDEYQGHMGVRFTYKPEQRADRDTHGEDYKGNKSIAPRKGEG